MTDTFPDLAGQEAKQVVRQVSHAAKGTSKCLDRGQEQRVSIQLLNSVWFSTRSVITKYDNNSFSKCTLKGVDVQYVTDCMLT